VTTSVFRVSRVVVGVFCTGKILGGQDRVFLFQSGLMNYEELRSTLLFILVHAPSIK
jgi:hypothetical protein